MKASYVSLRERRLGKKLQMHPVVGHISDAVFFGGLLYTKQWVFFGVCLVVWIARMTFGVCLRSTDVTPLDIR
jgi:hypothetical protein